MAGYTLADIDAAIAAKSAPIQGPSLDDIDAAIAARSKVEQPVDQPREKTGAAESFSDKFGNAGVFGYGPQIAGAVTKLFADSPKKLNDFLRDDLKDKQGKVPVSSYDPYMIGRDTASTQLANEQEDHPYISTAGSLAGGVAAGVATAGMLPGAQAARATTLAGRVGQGAIQGAKAGALYGAVSNPGDVEGQYNPLQVKERVGNALEGAKTGAFVGGAAPLVAQGIRSSVNAVSPAAKSAAQKLGKIFYVPEDATKAYIENPEALNNAPSREDISNRVLALKENAQNQVDKATQDLQDAKDAALATKYDTRAGLQDEKFSTSQSHQDALQAYNEKRQSLREALHKSSLTGLAGDVTDAVSNLKDQVVQGSGEAYDILGNAKGRVPTAPLIQTLQEQVRPLIVQGQALTPSARSTINEIQAMQNSLSHMGDSISMPEAKQLIQSLDDNIEYSKSAGSFSPETSRAFSSLRRAIDTSVKSQVPEYAEKMAEVSRQAQLLSEADKHFGTPEKAIANLNNIDSERGQAIHLPILNQLEQETGTKINPQVTDYLIKQKLLSSPRLFDQYMEQFPEAKALRESQLAKDAIQDPAYSRQVSESASDPAKSEIARRQAMLDQARDRSSKFNGVTPQSITSKTKALNGANQYGAQSTFGPIDQAYGTNFQKEIQARNMADAFSKDATRGSRFVNLGKAVGGSLGYAVGGAPGAAVGYGVGGGVGAVADVYGPQAFKKGLDIGMATGRMANNAANGIDNLVSRAPVAPVSVAQGINQSNVIQMPRAADQSPTKGPDKWANDGLNNLKGHISEDDRKLLDEHKTALLLDPNTKQLLITASNYRPGSKPLDDILKHLKKRLGEN